MKLKKRLLLFLSLMLTLSMFVAVMLFSNVMPVGATTDLATKAFHTGAGYWASGDSQAHMQYSSEYFYFNTYNYAVKSASFSGNATISLKTQGSSNYDGAWGKYSFIFKAKSISDVREQLGGPGNGISTGGTTEVTSDNYLAITFGPSWGTTLVSVDDGIVTKYDLKISGNDIWAVMSQTTHVTVTTTDTATGVDIVIRYYAVDSTNSNYVNTGTVYTKTYSIANTALWGDQIVGIYGDDSNQSADRQQNMKWSLNVVENTVKGSNVKFTKNINYFDGWCGYNLGQASSGIITTSTGAGVEGNTKDYWAVSQYIAGDSAFRIDIDSSAYGSAGQDYMWIILKSDSLMFGGSANTKNAGIWCPAEPEENLHGNFVALVMGRSEIPRIVSVKDGVLSNNYPWGNTSTSSEYLNIFSQVHNGQTSLYIKTTDTATGINIHVEATHGTANTGLFTALANVSIANTKLWGDQKIAICERTDNLGDGTKLTIGISEARSSYFTNYTNGTSNLLAYQNISTSNGYLTNSATNGQHLIITKQIGGNSTFTLQTYGKYGYSAGNWTKDWIIFKSATSYSSEIMGQNSMTSNGTGNFLALTYGNSLGINLVHCKDGVIAPVGTVLNDAFKEINSNYNGYDEFGYSYASIINITITTEDVQNGVNVTIKMYSYNRSQNRAGQINPVDTSRYVYELSTFIEDTSLHGAQYVTAQHSGGDTTANNREIFLKVNDVASAYSGDYVRYSASLGGGKPTEFVEYSKTSNVSYVTPAANATGGTGTLFGTNTTGTAYAGGDCYGAFYKIGNYNMTDFALTMKFSPVATMNDSRWLGLLYHTQYDASDNVSGYMMNLRLNGKSARTPVYYKDGALVTADTDSVQTNALAVGTVYTVRITVNGNIARHFISYDGGSTYTLIHSYNLTEYSEALDKSNLSGGFALILCNLQINIISLQISGSKTDNELTLPAIKEELTNAPASVIDVTDYNVLYNIACGTYKASSAILHVSPSAYDCIADSNNAAIATLRNAINMLGSTVPIIYITSEAQANAVITFLNANRDIQDVSVMSSNRTLIKQVWQGVYYNYTDEYLGAQEMHYVRGVWDASTQNVTKAGVLSNGSVVYSYDFMVAEANYYNANVIVLNQNSATREAVDYLQARFKTVWVRSNNVSNITGHENIVSMNYHDIISTGAYGIVTNDLDTLVEVYSQYSADQLPLARRPFSIAHRGDANYAENSFAAVDNAILNGATHVEIDIALTADNYIILMHDDTLARTCAKKANATDLNDYSNTSIRNLTLAQINTYEIVKTGNTAACAGEEIPKLTDILNRVANTDVVLVIEIKHNNQDIINGVKSIIDSFKTLNIDVSKNIVFVSFYQNCATAIAHAQSVMPHIPMALLAYDNGDYTNIGGADMKREGLHLATKFNAIPDIHYTDDYDADWTKPAHDLTITDARYLRDHGYMSFYWTFSSQAAFDTAIQIGTTGITHDITGSVKGYATKLTTIVTDLKDNHYLIANLSTVKSSGHPMVMTSYDGEETEVTAQVAFIDEYTITSDIYTNRSYNYDTNYAFIIFKYTYTTSAGLTYTIYSEKIQVVNSYVVKDANGEITTDNTRYVPITRINTLLNYPNAETTYEYTETDKYYLVRIAATYEALSQEDKNTIIGYDKLPAILDRIGTAPDSIEESVDFASDPSKWGAMEGFEFSSSGLKVQGNLNSNYAHIVSNQISSNANIDILIDANVQDGTWSREFIKFKISENTSESGKEYRPQLRIIGYGDPGVHNQPIFELVNPTTGNVNDNWVGFHLGNASETGYVFVCKDGNVSMYTKFNYSGYDTWYLLQQKTNVTITTIDTETGIDITVTYFAYDCKNTKINEGILESTGEQVPNNTLQTGRVYKNTISIDDVSLHGRQQFSITRIGDGRISEAQALNYYSVNVTELPDSVLVRSAAITTNPTKRLYTYGEAIDITGLVYTATMTDDSTKVIDNARITISPETTEGMTTGTHTITITYGGRADTFEIDVIGQFKMAYGSSARITNNNTIGMRYSTLMHKDDYSKLFTMKNQEDKNYFARVEIGVVIALDSYEELYGEFTEGTLFGTKSGDTVEGKVYHWREEGESRFAFDHGITVHGHRTLTDKATGVGGVRIMHFHNEAKDLSSYSRVTYYDEDSNYVTLNGCIVKMKQENLQKHYYGTAYMKLYLTDGDSDMTNNEVMYIWAEEDHNTRSVSYIARKTLLGLDPVEDAELYALLSKLVAKEEADNNYNSVISGAVFNNATYTYDKTVKTIPVTNLPDGWTYTVEPANVINAGTYNMTAYIYDASGILAGEKSAVMTVNKKPIQFAIDYKSSSISDPATAGLTYQIVEDGNFSGICEGDRINISLSVNKALGIQEITYNAEELVANNPNYDISVTKGYYTFYASIYDTSVQYNYVEGVHAIAGYNKGYLPSSGSPYGINKDLSGTTLTGATVLFAGFDVGYSAESANMSVQFVAYNMSSKATTTISTVNLSGKNAQGSYILSAASAGMGISVDGLNYTFNANESLGIIVNGISIFSVSNSGTAMSGYSYVSNVTGSATVTNNAAVVVAMRGFN